MHKYYNNDELINIINSNLYFIRYEIYLNNSLFKHKVVYINI